MTAKGQHKNALFLPARESLCDRGNALLQATLFPKSGSITAFRTSSPEHDYDLPNTKSRVSASAKFGYICRFAR